ncbi:hypothetical protein AVEN_38964-1 [Araneus ventricosus]|uniref:Uncharacterized protein n=1 Tax=Araneus ventricosus TaxID=182803 RepID=A0A4Y2MMQ0_ARAVE|nr:hypothetical protein AVEN_38964-1 [Araneus ventricosus]
MTIVQVVTDLPSWHAFARLPRQWSLWREFKDLSLKSEGMESSRACLATTRFLSLEYREIPLIPGAILAVFRFEKPALPHHWVSCPVWPDFETPHQRPSLSH